MALSVTTTSQAQDIIRFDDQAGGPGSPNYPGAPAPPPQQGNAEPSSTTASKVDARPGAEGGYSESTVFRAPPGESRNTDELLRKEQKEIYSGVIPGKRDEVKHIGRRATSEITWIGFLPERTRTRVFIQTSGTPAYQSSRSQNKLTLTFNNSKLAAKNFSRHIDTRFHGRDVLRIDTIHKRGSKVVRIDLTLSNNAEPSIDQRGEYIYIDFKHTPPKKEQDQPEQANNTR
jgi:hypothetical protein